MTELQKLFQTRNELIKSIQGIDPETIFMKSISKDIDLINEPFKDFFSHFNTFNEIILSPMISQMNELANYIKCITPDYTNTFMLSSSILELYSNQNMQIPDYLSDLTKACQPLIDTSQLFSAELSKMTLGYFQSEINTETIPDYLIAPKISGSAHYQSLKHLSYIDKKIDNDSENEYFELIDDNCSKAEDKINSVDTNWLILLKGAEESLVSRNPDKVRHTITSLRELITQILHTCAPDEDVRKIYTSPKCFYDGKPTRRTRIDFILQQKYKNSDLIEIIDKDTDAIIELFNVYQEGTHRILPTLKDEELTFIVKRTKLLIEQLI